jgi:hypothetical protein
MARNVELVGLTALATLGAVVATQRGGATRPSPRSGNTRAVDWASALLALSALADSSVEHYRGSFHNKTMYAPLAVSALTLAASLRDVVRSRSDDSGGSAVENLALATGIIGTGFHVYNIAKRPGGLSWLNLFYAAPLGAPAALSLAGLLRKVTRRLRERRQVGGVRPSKLLAGLVSAGLIGTSAEAGLLHFRGAYHNPAMVIPITAPPVAAALLAHAMLTPKQPHPLTRWSLRLLAGVGLLGSAFHAYGISRNMGGWRNWSQNLLNGPPLPAPPAFTALAIAGLVAVRLMERSDA